MKWRNKLQTKYLIIVFLALILLPFAIPIISVLYGVGVEYFYPASISKYDSGTSLEKMWHKEAEGLTPFSANIVNAKLEGLHKKYPEASIFWIDNEGNTQWTSADSETILQHWNTSEMTAFMKNSYNTDPFTVVAFIGGSQDNGIMVFQLPRTYLNPDIDSVSKRFSSLIIVAILFVLIMFMVISWLFFNRIGKRLIRLQTAMEQRGDNDIPEQVHVEKVDEIGQLEMSFNLMSQKLEESRHREQEENVLRRELIANVSHDLRTPLTTLRGHIFALGKESLSENGRDTLAVMDRKVTYMGDLIDNMQSYTLLAAGKYPYRPEKLDIVRIVRQTAATWYPIFEKERFMVEIDIPEAKVEWYIDGQWFERILDNVLQNVLRHAKNGRYVGIIVKQSESTSSVIIEDHGAGFEKETENKGAGIGLSIVSLMLKEMNFMWDIDSTPNGTTITIEKM